MRVAYAAQQPWIFHGTLRDNVLFGLEMVPERYYDVLAACGLLPDLHQLAGTAPTPLSSSPPSPPDASAESFPSESLRSRVASVVRNGADLALVTFDWIGARLDWASNNSAEASTTARRKRC